MRKWIRWQGLVAFLCVGGVLAVVWIFLADRIVEALIEKYGTEALGAKVELAEADLSLLPLGATLHQLQVTNPDAPMKNAVEVRRISFDLDALNLLRRKIIIEEMQMEGVRLGTDRKTSGALPGRKPRAKAPGPASAGGKSAGLPSFRIPDVKEILAREDLESLRLVNEVREELDAEKAYWQKTLKELPDRAKLDSYKKRIEDLKGARKGGIGGLLGAAGEASDLKKELETQLGRLKEARTRFDGKLQELKAKVQEVKKAPMRDIARLKKKYAVSPEGLAHMSALLFGPQVGAWMEKAAAWYERLQPMLSGGNGKKAPAVPVKQRGKGVQVKFPEKHGLPDFLIRRILASVELELGALSGRLENVTPQQEVLGRPLTFDFAGDRLKKARAVTLQGVLNRVVPSQPEDTLKLALQGLEALNVNLSQAQGLPLRLERGVLDLNLEGVLRGEKIHANIKGLLDSVRLATTKGGGDAMTQAILGALSDIRRFSATADIQGTLRKYSTRISSDLDRVLQDAVGKNLRKRAEAFEKELQAGVMAKVAGPTGEMEGGLGQLAPIGKELAGRLDLGQGLLGGLGGKAGAGGLKLPFSFK